MAKLFRVGIYLRLSNEDKDKNPNETSESIKNQRNMLLQYIAKQPNFYLVQEYCDEDLSGAGTYRPAFEQLIKDCENRKIDIVLCKSQSRFSRDMEIVEKYINNKFKEWNIRFIGLSDNADTFNQGNKKARQINGLVNEWFLEDVSNNIRSALYSKMCQGEFISPFAPYGYKISDKDNNKLVIDPNTSYIVKKIYHLYLKGFGFSTIANYLNKKNISSPSLYKYKQNIKLNVVSNKPREEIKWSPKAIKIILTNEVYLGHLVQGKRTTVSYKNHKILTKNKSKWVKVKNTHEAIIDEDIFNQVQKIINKRTRTIKTGQVHLFSGKVFCLECGHYMRKKNSSNHEYLFCPNIDCSNKKAIRYDILEALINDALKQKIKKYYYRKIFEQFKSKNDNNSTIKELEIQTININQNIKKVKNYLKSLYEDKVNGLITINQFHDLSLEYSEEEAFYTKQIKELEKEIKSLKNKSHNIENLDIEKIKLTPLIIDEFIEKIDIGKIDNNTRIIQIKWNFK